MSYIEKELERVTAALEGPLSPEDFRVMHAAQQALAWATDPFMFDAPHLYLSAGNVRRINGDNAGGSTGCFPDTHQHQS